MQIGGETLKDIRCKFRNGELGYYDTLKEIIKYPTENIVWIDDAITDLRNDFETFQRGEEFGES